MPNPKVSIIIPVLNSADTIERCVNSIVAQSESNWELIIADNGSMDGTIEIIRRLYKNDSRIRTISVDQKGVSYARNAALEIALGERICFIDGDDIIDANYLSSLLCCDTDLSVCGYILDFINEKGELLKSEEKTTDSLDWDIRTSRNILVPAFENGFMHFCWNKIFKREIILNHNIRFLPYPVNEDYIFVLQYLAYCNDVKVISIPLYHWRRQRGKITGVKSIPENILEIYNQSHVLTCEFFKDKKSADRIAYLSYEMLIYKNYEALKYGGINRDTYKSLC